MAAPRFWGFWTRGKLDLLRSYLAAFAKASKRSPQRIYLDLFAGGPEGRDRLTGELIPGSPRIALSVGQPQFSVLRFFEQEPTASALRSALTAEFPGREFKVIAGDCNETIVDALRDLKNHDRAATFAFIDPDGPDYRWSTIERLAAFKRTGLPKTELFVLVPAPMLIRLLPKDGSVTAKNAKRLTQMFGTDAWEQIYHARVANDLEPAEAREEYVNLVRWRLEHDLRYGWTHPLEVRNTRNVPIYYLVFATDHEVGNKIMTAVYGTASKEFKKLRQEAGQLRLAQEEEARGVLKLLSDDELSDLTSAPEPRGERYAYEPPWVPFVVGGGGR
jgi:three-Cys-motif partner protein